MREKCLHHSLVFADEGFQILCGNGNCGAKWNIVFDKTAVETPEVNATVRQVVNPGVSYVPCQAHKNESFSFTVNVQSTVPLRSVCPVCEQKQRVLDAEKDGFRELLQDHDLHDQVRDGRLSLNALRLFREGRMDRAPCFHCGYNGAGYYQPATHSCAKIHHMVSED